MQSPPHELDDFAALRELSPPSCVACDYSLVGLPPGTRCPECGAENDPSVITLCGWGKGSYASIATMRPGDAIISVVAVAAVCAWWAFEYFWGRGHRFPTMFIIFYAGWFGVLLFRRWSLVPSGASCPVRLRLSPAGYEQRLGPGPLHLKPWHRDMVVTLDIRKNRKQSLAVRWRTFSIHFSITSDLIGFDFDADAFQARQLTRHITQWIEAADGER